MASSRKQTANADEFSVIDDDANGTFSSPEAFDLLRQKVEIIQGLADHVLEKVNADGASGSAEPIRRILDQLTLKDLIKGKSALGGIGKNLKEHKVRPVPVLRLTSALISASFGQLNLSHNQEKILRRQIALLYHQYLFARSRMPYQKILNGRQSMSVGFYPCHVAHFCFCLRSIDLHYDVSPKFYFLRVFGNTQLVDEDRSNKPVCTLATLGSSTARTMFSSSWTPTSPISKPRPQDVSADAHPSQRVRRTERPRDDQKDLNQRRDC